MHNAMGRLWLISAVAATCLGLTGCISLGGGDPPETLLTLSSTASAPAGSGVVSGTDESIGAITILTPETPAKLDVLRVPVNISDTEVAFLQDAFWIEKPARLFRRLMGETLRTRGAALVIDTDDSPTRASRFLRGTLLDLTYDAPSNAVIMRYEAILVEADGKVVSRRFEAREDGVPPEAVFVGPALNRVANSVASEVANWVYDTD